MTDSNGAFTLLLSTLIFNRLLLFFIVKVLLLIEMSKFVVRTSGDGQESKLLERQQSEAAEASLAKTSNNEDIKNLGKKLLSNHLRKGSSSSTTDQQHLLLLDPSDDASNHISSLPQVEPKGRKIYLIPKLSQRFSEKMNTSISLNRKKLKLVPVEPYTVIRIIEFIFMSCTRFLIFSDSF